MIVAALTAVALAQAEPWRADPVVYPGWEIVGTTTSGSHWYIHLETGRRENNGYLIWVRINHSNDRTVSHRLTTGLLSITCDARLYRWASLARYSADGREIERGISQTEHIAPDTIQETIHRRFCAPAERQD